MALQLVDKAGDGEVTLVSMAPNNEMSGLRTALAMGAAKAILISDDALSGAGALDTAKVLAAAIKTAEPDLVLTATRGIGKLESHLDAVAVGLVEDQLAAAVEGVVGLELPGLRRVRDLLHAYDDVHGRQCCLLIAGAPNRRPVSAGRK